VQFLKFSNFVFLGNAKYDSTFKNDPANNIIVQMPIIQNYSKKTTSLGSKILLRQQRQRKTILGKYRVL
jgi:hypothetical protein